MKLRLKRHSVGDAVVVTAFGELDLFTAPLLREEATEAIENDGSRLVLDLSGVDFMDSSGLSALIEAWRVASAAGGAVTLAGPQEPVARVLSTTGLDRRLPVYPDVETAIAANTK
ncbi:STAS domain-containing protein [Bailinhaonella thermotolerans]|uniref:Anti-sigma factor antagonist n=1 Tax=Bailinhaonella thermotolerans TaxID=1070861 RepID=A0A3A4AU14_9ACTN|nr:STAS domain-containing protein [Bailinhaonella thermotolerans]RJL30804.1 anti-sigma factor antagonist [Bailinhaonella thermotolerans]